MRVAWPVAQEVTRLLYGVLDAFARATFGSVRQRVARHLLDLASGQPGDARPVAEVSQQALASAQQMRYMTEERFAQVKKGMTPSEVRAVLGPVNLHNVQEYPERKVQAWFYPREGGGASGVYFRLDEDKNVYTVYQTTFEVKGKEEAPGRA